MHCDYFYIILLMLTKQLGLLEKTAILNNENHTISVELNIGGVYKKESESVKISTAKIYCVALTVDVIRSDAAFISVIQNGKQIVIDMNLDEPSLPCSQAGYKSQLVFLLANDTLTHSVIPLNGYQYSYFVGILLYPNTVIYAYNCDSVKLTLFCCMTL